MPLRDLAGRFGVSRGSLQGLQKDAAVFCGMVVCFCRHLQWHELANVLFSFQVRNPPWVKTVYIEVSLTSLCQTMLCFCVISNFIPIKLHSPRKSLSRVMKVCLPSSYPLSDLSLHIANALLAPLCQDRLGYSAKPELLPLMRLSRDLPPFRARALFEAGYTSLLDLAGADSACLAEVFLRCSPFRRADWDESAVSAEDYDVATA